MPRLFILFVLSVSLVCTYAQNTVTIYDMEELNDLTYGEWDYRALQEKGLHKVEAYIYPHSKKTKIKEKILLYSKEIQPGTRQMLGIFALPMINHKEHSVFIGSAPFRALYDEWGECLYEYRYVNNPAWEKDNMGQTAYANSELLLSEYNEDGTLAFSARRFMKCRYSLRAGAKDTLCNCTLTEDAARYTYDSLGRTTACNKVFRECKTDSVALIFARDLAQHKKVAPFHKDVSFEYSGQCRTPGIVRYYNSSTGEVERISYSTCNNEEKVDSLILGSGKRIAASEQRMSRSGDGYTETYREVYGPESDIYRTTVYTYDLKDRLLKKCIDEGVLTCKMYIYKDVYDAKMPEPSASELSEDNTDLICCRYDERGLLVEKKIWRNRKCILWMGWLYE